MSKRNVILADRVRAIREIKWVMHRLNIALMLLEALNECPGDTKDKVWGWAYSLVGDAYRGLGKSLGKE